MKVLSLFSGIGLLDLGLAWAGMRTVGLCEIEPYCREVLAKHWPGVPVWADVREVTGDAVRERCGAVDLVAGGFPCQPHSVAGSRKGREDERHLWPEFARVVREVRPRWVLAENVPGLRTTAADEVLADLDAAGYSCWPLVVGADDVGAPHRRKRVWIVARKRLAHGDGERERDADEQGRQQRAGRAREADVGGRGEAVAHCEGERRALEGDGRLPGSRLGRHGAEGLAVAHQHGGGREGGRLEGGDAEGERGRDGASGDQPDGRGEWPVGEPTNDGCEWRVSHREASRQAEGCSVARTSMGEPTGTGLEGQRPDAGQPQEPERRHAGGAVDDSAGSGRGASRGAADGDSQGARAFQHPAGSTRWADPTILRGWPARPGEQQHEWEAPRLAYGEKSGQLRAPQLEDGGEGQRAGRGSDAAEQGALRAEVTGQPESGMGSAVDGRTGRMAGRVRRAQLKALGNGVVPAVAHAVGLAILQTEGALNG